MPLKAALRTPVSDPSTSRSQRVPIRTVALMERWRRVIGHDGYLVAGLRMATPAEGGRSRAVQSGYYPQWWRVDGAQESWLGGAPIDLLDDQRSIRPGQVGRVAIRPMDPQVWRDVHPGAVLHLRERVGQTLGTATVEERVGVPDHAPPHLDRIPPRPNAVLLFREDPTQHRRWLRRLTVGFGRWRRRP